MEELLEELDELRGLLNKAIVKDDREYALELSRKIDILIYKISIYKRENP